MSYRSPGRWLAPLALVCGVVAVYVVAAPGGEEADDVLSGSSSTTPRAKTTPRRVTRRPQQSSYVVRKGDVLSSIAVRMGVSVETIQRLNPKVDAQTLRPGQRLRLRSR